MILDPTHQESVSDCDKSARLPCTLKLDMGIISSTPVSIISITSPAKHRTQTRPWGRFLVCVPTRNREASFFEDQKVSDEASSNGRITFDFEKLMA